MTRFDWNVNFIDISHMVYFQLFYYTDKQGKQQQQ